MSESVHQSKRKHEKRGQSRDPAQHHPGHGGRRTGGIASIRSPALRQRTSSPTHPDAHTGAVLHGSPSDQDQFRYRGKETGGAQCQCDRERAGGPSRVETSVMRTDQSRGGIRTHLPRGMEAPGRRRAAAAEAAGGSGLATARPRISRRRRVRRGRQGMGEKRGTEVERQQNG